LSKSKYNSAFSVDQRKPVFIDSRDSRNINLQKTISRSGAEVFAVEKNTPRAILKNADFVTPTLYSVTYDEQGGSQVSNSQYLAEATIYFPSPPTRNGYNFLGWYLQSVGGSPLGSSYTPNAPYGDIVIYAHWQVALTSPLVQSTTYNPIGNVGTQISSPDEGSNDDGWWTVNLPYSISFNGISYSTIYISTNSFITFSEGSAETSPISDYPALDKIYINAGDRRGNYIYFQNNTTSWRIRYTGANNYNETSNDIIWELSSNSTSSQTLILNIVSIGDESGITGVYAEDGTEWGTLGGSETAWTITSQ
jgi:hypothetical protein